MNKINWWRTKLGNKEIKSVIQAIKHEHLSQGVVVKEFEENLSKKLNVPYVVCTTNGSSALLLAYIALGVKPNDEVIIPNRTFIATAHAALLLGAKVILVDTNKSIPTIDVNAIERKITKKTKVIVPVHLNGRSCDMNHINELAEKYGINVVEDSAQALFSRNKNGYLGTQSSIGIYSIAATKIITTGQGGFLVTKDKELYEKMRLIRNHGVVDTLKDSYNQLGFNFRYSDILASIGNIQLTKADKNINYVNMVYKKYESSLPKSIKMIHVDIQNGEVPLWVEVLCKEREKLMKYLLNNGVETRQFLPDLNLSQHLSNNGLFTNSKLFSKNGLILPCGPAQKMSDIEFVIDLLRKW